MTRISFWALTSSDDAALLVLVMTQTDSLRRRRESGRASEQGLHITCLACSERTSRGATTTAAGTHGTEQTKGLYVQASVLLSSFQEPI